MCTFVVAAIISEATAPFLISKKDNGLEIEDYFSDKELMSYSKNDKINHIN